MSIKLNLDSTLFTPKAYPVITDYSHRWEFWYGGAGSAKSYSIAQKLIIRACSEQIKILVCRRYGSTIRNTCFALFKEILEYWKLTPYITIRESDFNIKFPNGSEIIHCGLDEETKLLSLQGIGTIWVEEAFEVSKDIVEQLNLRMRSQNKNQQLILSWNPISQSHWLFDFVEVNPPKNSVKYHSTFKDNPFLSEEYIEALEDMKIRNPAKARIYYYGEWGLDPEGLVITNFEVKEFNPMELAEQKLEHRAGADLGWIDPTAIVDSLYDRENKIIYVFNEFYKSGQQLDNVVQAIKNMNLEKTKIYMDSAEPRSVAYFKSLGFNVVPSIKGKDSVKAGITFLYNHKIVVLPSCQKIIMELSNFSYKKDKMGEYQEDCYTHEYSHAIDALRYAYSDIYTRTKLKTFEKSVLGI